VIDTGLKGKVVLITGANNPRGIGAATALAFIREGASVFLTYLRLPSEPWGVTREEAVMAEEPGWPLYHRLRMEPADEVIEILRREGGRAEAWEADLTKPENIPLLFEKAEAEFGSMDVLVNSAAHYAEFDTAQDLTREVIDETYAVNTRATLLLMTEFAQRYKKNLQKWGRIINLSTGPAQYFTGQVAYGTSKAAIEAATRAVAAEIGPLGITVNTVAPGATQSGYIDRELEEELLPTVPMGRLGKPEDIANAILFLASDKAGWITGQVLRVTGGRNML
jgi:3-oxoacyl-[acyl-carrier protein] reductase